MRVQKRSLLAHPNRPPSDAHFGLMYRYGMAEKRRWSSLTPTQQRAIIVGAAIEIVVTALALKDLARRSSSQVRGPKAGWALSFVVQPFGPLVYFALGRRRS